MSDEHPSDAVRRAVESSGLTRYEIAKRSGVSESVLSRFVTKKRTISIETLDKLAPVLGLTIRVQKPK